MAEIKAILFDKDGTLLDFHETWMPAIRAVALSLAEGNEALAEMLMLLGGLDGDSGRIMSGSTLAAGDLTDIAALFAPHIEPAAATDIEALKDRIDQLFIDNMSPVPVCDLAALAASLTGAGYKLGVATSDSEAGARASLAGTGFLEACAFHCGFDSGHGRKPSPGMVRAFCAAIGVAPAEIVMVGDNAHDIEMGHAAGAAASIGVLTGTSSRAELEAMTPHVLGSIEELRGFLEEFRAG